MTSLRVLERKLLGVHVQYEVAHTIRRNLLIWASWLPAGSEARNSIKARYSLLVKGRSPGTSRLEEPLPSECRIRPGAISDSESLEILMMGTNLGVYLITSKRTPCATESYIHAKLAQTESLLLSRCGGLEYIEKSAKVLMSVTMPPLSYAIGWEGVYGRGLVHLRL